MSKPPIPKEQDPTEWGIFFKTEMKMNKIRRGIDQAEKFSADEIRVLIGEMVLECQKPPYNQIEKVIIQNVVKDAVLNDPDFFYFTVSWIRKILNKWWYLSGWKHVEKLQREKEAEAEKNKPVPSKNEYEDLLITAELELKRRAQETPEWMKNQRHVKFNSFSGSESKSNLERKGVSYSNNMTVEDYVFRECILKAKSDFYVRRVSFSLNEFIVNDYKMFAESESDAKVIYEDAKQRYPDALKRFLVNQKV
jgi:hypothetical protein